MLSTHYRKMTKKPNSGFHSRDFGQKKSFCQFIAHSPQRVGGREWVNPVYEFHFHTGSTKKSHFWALSLSTFCVYWKYSKTDEHNVLLAVFTHDKQEKSFSGGKLKLLLKNVLKKNTIFTQWSFSHQTLPWVIRPSASRFGGDVYFSGRLPVFAAIQAWHVYFVLFTPGVKWAGHADFGSTIRTLSVSPILPIVVPRWRQEFSRNSTVHFLYGW